MEGWIKKARIEDFQLHNLRHTWEKIDKILNLNGENMTHKYNQDILNVV